MIRCRICGEAVHAIRTHIKVHEDWDIARYESEFPDAPLLSDAAAALVDRRAREKKAAVEMEMAGASVTSIGTKAGRFLHEVFELGDVAAAKNAKGNAIPITVLHSHEDNDLIPEIDTRYVFPITLLKNVMMGIEMNIPVYLWGHAGVGKSTIIEQVAARTRRPYMRIQHTSQTEESHIVGQVLANESGTYFEPGPLALAMKRGWVYNADEYDFAHPSVTALYQAVLEGKSLVIKDAPSEWRVINPHQNFRFLATGNTNGSGDETGLYNGTQMGNAANYSRFGITDKVTYMDKALESAIITAQAGIRKQDAELLCDYASKVREAFDTRQISATIGPRELIYAAKLGMAKQSFIEGLNLAYINRLAAIDAEIVGGIAQRIFG